MRSPAQRGDGWAWTEWDTCWATNWAYCVGPAAANETKVDCYVSCASFATFHSVG